MTGHLLRAGSITLGMKFIGVGLLLIATLVMTRVLGPEQYGLYVLAFAAIGMLSEPPFVALRTLGVRYGSIHLAADDGSRLLGLLHWLRRIALGLALAAAGIILAGVWLAGDRFHHLIVPTALIGAMLPLSLGYNRVSDGLLRADGAILAGQAPKLILRPLLLLSYLLIMVSVVGDGLDAAWVMAAQVAAAATVSLLYAGLIKRRFGRRFRPSSAISPAIRWRTETLPLMTTTLIEIVNVRLALIMVGVMTSPAEAGSFQLALRIAELIALVAASANLVIEPRIAREMTIGSRQDAQRTMTLAARLTFVAMVPIGLAVISFGASLLSLFGEGFTDAAAALTVLVIWQTLSVALGSVTPVLNITGLSRIAATGSVIRVAVTILLCFVLIPDTGAQGAAWAVLGASILSKLWLMRAVHKHLGLYTTILGVWVRPVRWRALWKSRIAGARR